MNKLIDLIRAGKTQFHVVEYSRNILLENGFAKLEMYDDWNLVDGGKYFIEPFPSMMVAFVYGDAPSRLRIAAAHTDFPMLKLKSKPEITRKGYMLANVEPYGGLIISAWFDRPLGLAGKIISKGEDAFSPVTTLFDSKKPIFTIPNLAPHLRREKAQDIDVQKEIVPLCGCNIPSSEDFLMDYIANESGISKQDILDYDLYLYLCEEPTYIGLDSSLLSSPRIDNLSSVAAILDALTTSNVTNQLIVGAFFDNEEIGSRSKQGADSMLLRDIISKIIPNESIYKNAFYLSMDVAHATHPNYMEKSDITNDIILGNGVALKTSATQRYVTDSEALAVITAMCAEKKIKVQKQVNRSGMPGGQTLGPIMSTFLPVKAVDLGVPMLAMHSARELIHKNDYDEIKKLTVAFFEY